MVNKVEISGVSKGELDESSGALPVQIVPYPPITPMKFRFFRQFLTDDGTTSGSNDMGIDGSTPVDFYVEASQTADRYITSIDFIMGYGNTAQPYQLDREVVPSSVRN